MTILSELEAKAIEFSSEIVEKSIRSSSNKEKFTLPNGSTLNFDDYGGAYVCGPQRHIGSISDTDDIFISIKTLLETEALNRPLNFFLKDKEDKPYVPFRKENVEDELHLPCVTFSVVEEEPGPFGRGGMGQPNTVQLKPVLRTEFPDPDDANKTIFLFSRRLAGKIKLTCWAEQAKDVDDLRKWLDHVIQMNMWYFTYSGLNQFHFSKRLTDSVVKVSGKSMHSRSLEYYFMYEKLQWQSEDNLKTIILQLNLVS